ncbi:amino acid permease, partial [Limosilactobacillus fermentum]|nr:amino acid permease [Limosilactobacillus fermentum]
MCAYKKGGSFIDREVDDKSMKMGGTACDDVPGINYQGRLFLSPGFPKITRRRIERMDKQTETQPKLSRSLKS